MKTLFNPFNFLLKKQATQKIDSKPVYTNGEFAVYKYAENHFIYTFKNVVIAERGYLIKEMIDDLANDSYTGEPRQKYSNFFRPKETLKIGIDAAKELRFTIE